MKPNDELHFKYVHGTEEFVIIEVHELWVTYNMKERAVNHKETDGTFFREELEKMIMDGRIILVKKEGV